MKKNLLSFILAIAALSAFAQQDPQFTQNMFMKLPVNPGYAGTRGTFCTTTAYRTQWVGFSGAPKSFFLSTDIPVMDLSGGLGLTVMKDKLGNFNFTYARAAYSYLRTVNQGIGLLGIGADLGVLQSSVDNNWLAPDGSHGESDNGIPEDVVHSATYDFGLGIYYRTNDVYVGFSTSHVPGNSEKLTAPQFDYRTSRHYYLMAGYNFRPSPVITLRPSFFAKTDGAVTTFDIHCDALYNDFVWGGLSYRLQDAIAPSVGIAFQPSGPKSASILKIGYSYDIGISGLKDHHNNTHEILVSYCVKWGKPIGSHINPRLMTNGATPDVKFTNPHWYE